MEQLLTDPIAAALTAFAVTVLFVGFAFVEDLKGRPLTRVSYLKNLTCFSVVIFGLWGLSVIIYLAWCLPDARPSTEEIFKSYFAFGAGVVVGWVAALQTHDYIMSP